MKEIEVYGMIEIPMTKQEIEAYEGLNKALKDGTLSPAVVEQFQSAGLLAGGACMLASNPAVSRRQLLKAVPLGVGAILLNATHPKQAEAFVWYIAAFVAGAVAFAAGAAFGASMEEKRKRRSYKSIEEVTYYPDQAIVPWSRGETGNMELFLENPDSKTQRGGAGTVLKKLDNGEIEQKRELPLLQIPPYHRMKLQLGFSKLQNIPPGRKKVEIKTGLNSMLTRNTIMLT